MMKAILTATTSCIALISGAANAACDHRLIIVNHSNYWVDAVYATNVNNGKWGPNRIANAICPNCQSIVTLNDRSGYVNYDILAVSTDGFTWEIDFKNICVFTKWDLYN